jgi:diguanylate cyclase (GGDEF)-like protein
MTDYQILTIIAAFIIVDIAVLSLVAIPLMRRRLAARIDRAAATDVDLPAALKTDPLAMPSAGRLAAAIGARPTLSAPIPSLTDIANGAVDPDDLPIAASVGEIDENGTPDTEAPDVVDSIAAARAATEAWQSPTSVTTDSDDAQYEAQRMDPAEMSVARARGFAIHPEDPLVASTIDRLLGARREADATTVPATADAVAIVEGTQADDAPPPGAPMTAEVAGDSKATNGISEVHLSGELHVTKDEAAPEGEAATSAPPPPAIATSSAGGGRPVMAAMGLYTSEGVLEPTIDPVTGLDSALSWAMAVTIEEARSGRYGRPVSVVIAELDGLEKLSELFGAEVADKLIPPVADALRRSARAADRVARLAHNRFGVLLVETDEVRAINYVERVRSACDTWLEASAIALRLSIGWASPATDGDLRSAVRIAEERMHREQRRPAPWRPAEATAPGAPTTSDS